MRKTITAVLALLSAGVSAQDIAPKKYINHHRFEISLSAGTCVNNKITGDAWAIRNRRIHDGSIYSASLGVYFTKRMSAGVKLNSYKWNIDNYFGRPGVTNAMSYSAFFNYDQPVRNSIFYGGVSVGRANAGYIKSETALNDGGQGMEFNAHVGYKLTLVRSRFWLFLEAGATQSNIKGRANYAVINYPLTAGLRFKI